MGKHSLQRESRLPNSVKGALVMGAVASATGAMPAVSAMAQTINVPGVGDFDVPVDSSFTQQVKAVNQALADHADLIKDHADQIKAAQKALAPQSLQQPNIPGLTAALPGVNDHQGPQNIALTAAKSKIGSDYVWGASGPQSFDCSGLVQWAYKQAGVNLPRTSFEQSHVGKPVAYQDLQPGDLVIQEGGGHVAMYAGDGKILQAPQSGETVSYAHLDPHSIVTARRVA
ncbi:C40 family peptidase [Nocardia vaccinii]|uniref:C40 family peptidase n=1 Tax=Nocardia vaccinii TaxID=1822 RepID=UPI000ADD6EB0|nr:C40 family peptidase [Nocardia vaccinii]